MRWRSYIWIVLGAFTLLLNLAFGRYTALYEVIYLQGVFQLLRVVYDHTLGLLPFPMVYFLFFLLVHFIYRFTRFKGWRTAQTTRQKMMAIAMPVMSFFGAAIFLFYFLWGFNYHQAYITKRLGFEDVPSDTTVLYQSTVYMAVQMSTLRHNISSDTLGFEAGDLPADLETDIRTHLEEVFDAWDIPTWGRVRVRKLRPRGILLRISTAGVYIPYALEGHIDAGLHPIQVPFTMAHEMSHGYGITDEGTCNFTGFVACIASDDPFVQYSARLMLWRYMASNLSRAAPTLYQRMITQLDPLVRKDLQDISRQMDKYPDIMPKVRDMVYDTYLRTHGVSDGLSNYSTIVRLVMQWQASGRDQELVAKTFGTDRETAF